MIDFFVGFVVGFVLCGAIDVYLARRFIKRSIIVAVMEKERKDFENYHNVASQTVEGSQVRSTSETRRRTLH